MTIGRPDPLVKTNACRHPAGRFGSVARRPAHRPPAAEGAVMAQPVTAVTGGSRGIGSAVVER
ncbi:hypothetical protein, partial [Streptomyces sparsus]